MTHSAQLERVREFVHRTFTRLAGSSPSEVRESILVHDGQYCGRRFSSDLIQAVWFVEENELKFCGQDGTVLKVAVADMATERRRRTAA